MSIDILHFVKRFFQIIHRHKKRAYAARKGWSSMPVYPNIKNARMAKKMSQREVAEVLGMPKQQYSLYETGQREMPLHYLIETAKFYGVTLDYLAGLTDEQGNPS